MVADLPSLPPREDDGRRAVPIRQSPPTILVIEDEPGVACLQRRTLERAGYRVVLATDSRQALTCLQSSPIHLIVLDFYLPEGVTGIEFCEELKTRELDLPVILVTGKSAESLVIEAMRAGVRDFVIKTPDYLDYLPHSIERVLKQVELEGQLRQSEERYRSLVTHAWDAIVTISPDGRITSLNPAFERITGWQCEEWLGKNFPALVHPEDQKWLTRLFRRVLQGDGPHALEMRVLAKTGNFIPTEFTVTPQCLGETTVGVIGVGRDMRPRRNLEEQIRQMQKLESIGQFAAGIAHDFNNIVTVQQGFASLLLGDPELASKHADLVQQFAEASERAAQLTRQLLLFSRKEALQPQRLDLNQIVQQVSRLLLRILGEDVHLELACSPHLPRVLVDPSMMEQILMNLAINARDAMPHGGTLTIATSTASLDELAAQANPESRPGQFVRLEVRDSGTGIAPEVLRQIFEPLFTTKAAGKGTGLGLATVHGIVKQHQGWIQVQTDVGRGTSFEIYLPVPGSEHLPSAEADVPHPGTFWERAEPARPAASVPLRSSTSHDRDSGAAAEKGKESILVVEDEVSVRQMVTLILQKCGYQVLTAGSGVHALEVWRERDRDIDLLITDMVMPMGVSGSQLAERLRQEKPALKVIFTSGYVAEASGFDTCMPDRAIFLQKPYSPRQLAQTVRHFLDEPSAPSV
jgi:PAS domain S-box-containing protein